MNMKAMHSKPIFMSLIGMLLLAIFWLFIWFRSPTERALEGKRMGKDISAVILSVGSREQETLEMHITDPVLIHKLVEEPISKSVLDPKPARYEVLGTLSIEYQDGSRDVLWVFIPWGHYKRDEQYRVADFSPLAKEFRKLMDESTRFMNP
jgi:hypothetical protein